MQHLRNIICRNTKPANTLENDEQVLLLAYCIMCHELSFIQIVFCFHAVLPQLELPRSVQYFRLIDRFLHNCCQRFSKRTERLFAFRFGGLDHECFGNNQRETCGRRMGKGSPITTPLPTLCRSSLE